MGKLIQIDYNRVKNRHAYNKHRKLKAKLKKVNNILIWLILLSFFGLLTFGVMVSLSR